jgi:hypothetical protein
MLEKIVLELKKCSFSPVRALILAAPFEDGRCLLKLSLAVFVLYKPESSANPFLGFSFLCAIRESQKLSTLPYILDSRRRKHQTKADVPKIPSARITGLLKRL